MAGDHDTESPEEAEGGPVKSFLEHLEDFRWVLIKSLVALGLGMLICLFGANHVVDILKWPLSHNPIRRMAQTTKWHFPFASTNQPITQIAIVSFGTNHLGNFPIAPDERKSLNLGTNPYVTVRIEPLTIGPNQVLGWHVTPDPSAADVAQSTNIELVNLSPAGGFFVAFQVAF